MKNKTFKMKAKLYIEDNPEHDIDYEFGEVSEELFEDLKACMGMSMPKEVKRILHFEGVMTIVQDWIKKEGVDSIKYLISENEEEEEEEKEEEDNDNYFQKQIDKLDETRDNHFLYAMIYNINDDGWIGKIERFPYGDDYPLEKNFNVDGVLKFIHYNKTIPVFAPKKIYDDIKKLEEKDGKKKEKETV